MGDLKSELEKTGMKGTIEIKKCRKCGKPLSNPKFDLCKQCADVNKKKDNDTHNLPEGYLNKLQKGYFDTTNCLHEDFITTFADKIAQSFKGLKNHQLRRFYNHVKAAETRLKMTNDWNCVNLDIKKLCSFVAEAKGKGNKIPENFYQFIDKNIKKIDSQRDFEAFVTHFEAVVGYFAYYSKS